MGHSRQVYFKEHDIDGECNTILSAYSMYGHLTHSHTMTLFDAPGKQAF